MRRILSFLGAIALSIGWLMAAPAPARAAGSDWQINSYDVVAQVDRNGVTHVQATVAFDFGSEAGHGPFLAFPLRQEDGANPDRWRMYDYSIGAVTSPSGANTQTEVGESDGVLVIKVGTASRSYTGVQTYQINYSVRGLVEPNQSVSHLDEFNWQVIGPSWEVPIKSVRVTLTGPANPTKVACFYDGGLNCKASATGPLISYRASLVGDGRGVQVVAGYPVHTFVGAEPRYSKRMHLGNMFPVNGFTAPVAAAVAAAGLFLLYRRTRRSARDQVYLGLTPGVTPASGHETDIGYDQNPSAPVAVAFQPPADALPGEVGTLIDATADDRDITATMVDLAVRGHLTIEQTGRKDFTFTQKQTDDPTPLVGYEKVLISELFRSGSEVTTDDLRDQSYAGMMSAIRSSMYTQVTTQRRWFANSPRLTRFLAVAAALVLIAGGVGLGYLLGMIGWGLVGIAVVIVGLGVLIMNNKFGRRTAQGSAVLAQAKGFELYLRTAEADQIRFEEGIDIFSRYLPYAMVFGVADRWTKVFEQLAADGRYDYAPTWYYGYGFGTGFGLGNLSSSLSSMATSMSSSLQAASAATSGGSGFSGGGGFGGGGGGGW